MQYRNALSLLVVPALSLWAAYASFDPSPAAGHATAGQDPETGDIVVRDGEEALTRLVEGNQRFVSGELAHPHQSPARRAKLAGGQKPYAIILGCADSRVPPEIIFDVGLGDAFVIRVAGNLPGPYEAGSIEYAVEHLGTPLVLVLGHEGCGAVTAALAPTGANVPEELEGLLDSVREALGQIDPNLPENERIRLGVEANVRRTLKQLRKISDRIGFPDAERVTMAGGVYELATGRVRIIDPPE